MHKCHSISHRQWYPSRPLCVVSFTFQHVLHPKQPNRSTPPPNIPSATQTATIAKIPTGYSSSAHKPTVSEPLAAVSLSSPPTLTSTATVPRGTSQCWQHQTP